MKIYLIMLAISFVSMIIVNLEIIGYKKDHYKRIKKENACAIFSAYCKIVIMVLLIVPYTLNLLMSLFAYNTFIQSIDNAFSNNEYFEAI